MNYTGCEQTLKISVGRQENKIFGEHIYYIYFL